VSGHTKLDWLTQPELGLSPAALQSAETIIAGRAAGVPLQHLLGTAPFWGMTLTSSSDALVPGPETERLVELGLEAIRTRTVPVVLDLGTGSGAIAAAIATERPDAEVWASERSAEAAALAEKNLATYAPNVRLLQADLLARAELQQLLPRLDLLLANLPYLPDEDATALPPEVQHDPPEALFGGADGLDVFRRAWTQAEGSLARTAVAIFELDPRNVHAAEAWLQARPLPSEWTTEVAQDLAGKSRFLVITPR